MSNPDIAAAQGSENENLQTSEQPNTFQDKVNSVVKQMTQDGKGIWQMPADLEVDESVAYAAKLEKRRRDTESALDKTRQQLSATETIKTKLEQRIADQVQLNMSPEQQEELDSLKYDDPEQWRVKMNQLEQQAQTTLREELSGLSSEASQQAEITRRAQVLDRFNQEHPDVQIDDDVLANDIPPRFTKQLENGEVTFEEFLDNSRKFLTGGKVVKDVKADAPTNLGTVGGGDNPAADAVKQENTTSYENEIF